MSGAFTYLNWQVVAEKRFANSLRDADDGEGKESDTRASAESQRISEMPSRLSFTIFYIGILCLEFNRPAST